MKRYKNLTHLMNVTLDRETTREAIWLRAIQYQARKMMDVHGLNDWTFAFNKATRSFGMCYSDGRIKMSRPMCKLNDWAEIKMTILHEIAHALAPVGSGHDATWSRICKEIGGDGNRFYNSGTRNVTNAVKVNSVFVLRPHSSDPFGDIITLGPGDTFLCESRRFPHRLEFIGHMPSNRKYSILCECIFTKRRVRFAPSHIKRNTIKQGEPTMAANTSKKSTKTTTKPTTKKATPKTKVAKVKVSGRMELAVAAFTKKPLTVQALAEKVNKQTIAKGGTDNMKQSLHIVPIVAKILVAAGNIVKVDGSYKLA